MLFDDQDGPFVSLGEHVGQISQERELEPSARVTYYQEVVFTKKLQYSVLSREMFLRMSGHSDKRSIPGNMNIPAPIIVPVPMAKVSKKPGLRPSLSVVLIIAIEYLTLSNDARPLKNIQSIRSVFDLMHKP
jgi:hypothetical protein